MNDDNRAGRTMRGRRKLWAGGGWVVGAALVLAVGVGLFFLKIERAELALRGVVVDALSARFDSRVELDSFRVSLSNGLRVSGSGLRLFGKEDPNNHEPGVQPLLSAAEFSFRMGLLDLLRSPKHVDIVYVKGMVMNLPPREQRAGIDAIDAKQRKIEMTLDRLVCDQVVLVINTLRPGKLPVEFDIESLKMNAIGPGEPMHFDARLTNPKPIGDIVAGGSFGPWDAENPRATPVNGSYTFRNANLGTIRGIGGTLSSDGEYAGTLERIAVEGTTDTPDFRLAISGRPIPLHTDFHAIVDGTSGDTYLEPVKAKILGTSLVAKGSVVRKKDPAGHEIELDVTIDDGKIDDLLKLAVRTEPPMMSGKVRLKTKLSLLPGEAEVAERLQLQGNFAVSGAHFGNEKIQAKVDALSMRSQGKPLLATDNIPDNMHSGMEGTFALSRGVLRFSQLEYDVPGTKVNLAGTYSLDGNEFDFHGKARLDARLSHMVTGWRSILLKPADPFFSKHGAGTEIPVKISGTKSEPHFGLDFGHKAGALSAVSSRKDKS